MPGGLGQGSWLGPPTAEGPRGPKHTHPWGTKEHLHLGTRPSLGVPHPPGSPPWLHVAHARVQAAAPPFPQGRPSCRSQVEKSLQKHHPHHIGKCSKNSSFSPTSKISLPSGVSWTPPGAGQDNRGYSGLHGGIFTALAGPHSWGSRGRDLRKTFLKLLLLRLWWLGPNLFGQALRPRGMPYKCLILQEALRGPLPKPLGRAGSWPLVSY